MSETRANIKQWFAAEIFQEGRRVVWTHHCPHLNALTSLSVVRVGFVTDGPHAGATPTHGDGGCGGLLCHVDFGGYGDDSISDMSNTHCCTCELELFDPST